MTFLWHDALWLLSGVPLLIGFYVLALRRRKAALRIPSVEPVRAAMAPVQRLKPHVPPLLFLLALIAMLVAVSRPAAVATVPSEQRTVVLAIDVSLSMGAADVAPTRLKAAQAAARAFVLAQPADVRVGVVAFAGHADLVQPPTTRRSETLAAIDQLQLQYSTAIGNGVVAALATIFPDAGIGSEYDLFGLGQSPRSKAQNAALAKVPAPRERAAAVPAGSFQSAAIVLLTDGRSTFGIHHTKAAEMAAERGVRVYTVGFGQTGAASIEVAGTAMDVEFDEAALKEIAGATRGGYFHASTAEELKSIYRRLSGAIVLERKLLELTALFTALGALLSLSSVGLSFAWGPRFA